MNQDFLCWYLYVLVNNLNNIVFKSSIISRKSKFKQVKYIISLDNYQYIDFRNKQNILLKKLFIFKIYFS